MVELSSIPTSLVGAQYSTTPYSILIYSKTVKWRINEEKIINVLKIYELYTTFRIHEEFPHLI